VPDFVHLQPAHRILAARWRLRIDEVLDSGGGARDVGDGCHRAREHVLVGDLPRSRAQARHQADPRVRGVCGPGQPSDQERQSRRDRETISCCWRKTPRAITTSSSWCRRATPTGSTTSRESTRRCLAQYSKGLSRPEQLPEGRGRRGLSRQQEKRAIEAAGAYRDILGPNNFFLEMQWHGIEDQRVVNSGLPAIARDLKLPLVCTNDVHYLRAGDANPHDVLAVHRDRQGVQRSQAPPVRREAVLLKTYEEMAEVFKRLSRGAGQHRPESRSARDVTIGEGENFLPNFDVPAPFTLDDYFEARDARGVQRAAYRGSSSWRWPARCATRSTSTSAGCRMKSR